MMLRVTSRQKVAAHRTHLREGLEGGEVENVGGGKREREKRGEALLALSIFNDSQLSSV